MTVDVETVAQPFDERTLRLLGLRRDLLRLREIVDDGLCEMEEALFSSVVNDGAR